jgi:hypothetical protein
MMRQPLGRPVVLLSSNPKHPVREMRGLPEPDNLPRRCAHLAAKARAGDGGTETQRETKKGDPYVMAVQDGRRPRSIEAG